MNDHKELLAELRKCKYCARDIAKYASDAIEQIIAEYNELDKAHGELFLEYHKVKKQRDAATIDAVPISELEELRDYLYEEDLIFMRGLAELNKLIAKYGGTKTGKTPDKNIKP